MQQKELIPHLFRTEYQKLVAVLCKLFGLDNIDVAEDIASDTFLQAAETWSFKGLPENPVAWLYTVAKNKAKDYLKREKLFNDKVKPGLKNGDTQDLQAEVDLSNENILDSQLQMMFAICHPCISAEAQVGLSLRILCGFGIDEIAAAFLTNKEAINKRVFRAKEKLRAENVRVEFPCKAEIGQRLNTVLTTLYLLFNEGYFSSGSNIVLRKDLCFEAMRLTHLLTQNQFTNTSSVSALLALMCFHSSRFEARVNQSGEIVLYQQQDTSKWNKELIGRGQYFLCEASKGDEVSKYHYEAAIAFWHTQQADTDQKWNNILQLYNQLLMVEYSPMAALNRTYALCKVQGKCAAIAEAERLALEDNLLYHSLLGELYTGISNHKAKEHLQKAFALSRSDADKTIILNRISLIEQGS